MKLKPETIEPTHIIAILDRSGSMGMNIKEYIGSFNRFLDEQRKLPGEAFMSLVLFDDKYEIVYDDVPIAKVPDLDNKTFVPRGMTALHDALGITLSNALKAAPKRCIVTVLTDGLENASKEYTSEQVKNLVKQAEARDWQIVYIAANQDAFKVGGQLGVNINTISNYTADAQGITKGILDTSAMVSNYRLGT